MEIDSAHEAHTMTWRLVPAQDGSEDVQLTESRWDSRTAAYAKTTTTIRPDRLVVTFSRGRVYQITVSGRKLVKDGSVGTRRDAVGWTSRYEFSQNAPVWLQTHMFDQPDWVR